MQTDNKNINHSEQYLTISYWDFGLSMLANPPGNYFLKFPGFKAESRAHAALVYWLSRSGADGTLHDCCTVPPHSFHWQYFVILTLAVTRNHEIFASQYTWNLQVHHHVLHLGGFSWNFLSFLCHTDPGGHQNWWLWNTYSCLSRRNMLLHKPPICSYLLCWRPLDQPLYFIDCRLSIQIGAWYLVIESVITIKTCFASLSGVKRFKLLFCSFVVFILLHFIFDQSKASLVHHL